MNVVNIQPDWADDESMVVMKWILDNNQELMSPGGIDVACAYISMCMRKVRDGGYRSGVLAAEKVALKHRPAPMGEECPGCDVLSEIRKIRPLK